MNKHTNEKPSQKDALLQELGDKLVQMGWFVPNSAGVRDVKNAFRSASEATLKGLITACERRIANPPRC